MKYVGLIKDMYNNVVTRLQTSVGLIKDMYNNIVTRLQTSDGT
jgi:hypothetical protein